MRFTLCALVAAATAVSAQSATIVPAPQISDSPEGASYVATLPEKGTVRGSIIGVSGPNGKGTKFSIAVSGLPAEGGPFMYHIHEKPVPANGNCSGTGAHLDPYKRGEVPACDSSKKETCQTGDLAGKYRNLTGLADSDSYLDLYTSTNPADPSFFGDRSIVIHLSNKTRISCANFTLQNGGIAIPSSGVPSSGYALPTGIGGNGTYSAHQPSGTGSGNGPSNPATFTSAAPTQPPTPKPSSGASRLMVAGAGVLAGAVAMIL